MPNFSELFAGFGTIKAGVIGDLMLDTYLWGHVERISPEAPVPVVTLDSREYRIGGAGNVALNLAVLGAKVTTFSVLGRDTDGETLEGLLENRGVDVAYHAKSDTRITTSKARVMGRNQQMMRLDSETVRDLTRAEEDELLGHVRRYLECQPGVGVCCEAFHSG